MWKLGRKRYWLMTPCPAWPAISRSSWTMTRLSCAFICSSDRCLHSPSAFLGYRYCSFLRSSASSLHFFPSAFLLCQLHVPHPPDSLICSIFFVECCLNSVIRIGVPVALPLVVCILYKTSRIQNTNLNTLSFFNGPRRKYRGGRRGETIQGRERQCIQQLNRYSRRASDSEGVLSGQNWRPIWTETSVLCSAGPALRVIRNTSEVMLQFLILSPGQPKSSIKLRPTDHWHGLTKMRNYGTALSCKHNALEVLFQYQRRLRWVLLSAAVVSTSGSYKNNFLVYAELSEMNEQTRAWRGPQVSSNG